jgi:phosphate-selective porin OprO and OprP
MKNMRRMVFLSAAMIMALLVVHADVHGQDFKVRGRVHMDAIYGIQDADQFSNGFNNRRARMGMTGKLNANWDAIIEFDFADATIAATDVRIRRRWANGSAFSIGHFKVPMGLNQLTSSNSITFIERSSVSNIIPDARHLGLAYYRHGDLLSVETMVFGRSMGTRAALVSDMPLGLAVRGFTSPKFGEGQLHVGISMAYQELWANDHVRLSDRPEALDAKGGSVRFLNTDNIADVRSTFKAGAEVMYLQGPLLFEAEWLQVSLDRKNEKGLYFSGFYIQASYMLSGGVRTYRSGVVGGIAPQGEKGAWEVAMRYSTMDLNDDLIIGGNQQNVTVGVNHYVISKLRFMANIIYMNTDQLDNNPIVGLLRAQYNF